MEESVCIPLSSADTKRPETGQVCFSGEGHHLYPTVDFQRSPAGCTVISPKIGRFELLKNVVFWEVTPCGSCRNRRFVGTYRLHHHGDKNQRTRNNVSSK
jgi:fatty acid desaturase